MLENDKSSRDGYKSNESQSNKTGLNFKYGKNELNSGININKDKIKKLDIESIKKDESKNNYDK